MASDRKRKRGTKFTRHRKAGWKIADIADIEEAIDERRETERLGFDKNSDFFIDDSVKKPDNEQAELPSRAKTRKSDGQIRTDSVLDGIRLRCFATLEAQSAIPALPSQSGPRAVVESPRKITKLAASGELHRKKLDQQKSNPANRYYDLWDTADSADVKKHDNENENRGEQKSQKRVAASSQAKQQTAGRKQRRGLELPHAGQSYNPLSQDHSALLNEAFKNEQRKARAAARLERSLKFTRSGAANTGDDINADVDVNHDSAENEQPNEAEAATKQPRPVKQSAKPKRTREQKERRVREQQVREAGRRFEKERARVSAQATRVDAIRKEIDRAEREHTRLRKEAALRKRVKEAKLGPFRYEDDDLAIKLPEELGADADAGSLRRLRPEGNLLRERFRSMQRRGIVEVRHRVQVRRKYTPKSFDRKSTQNMLSRKLAAPSHAH